MQFNSSTKDEVITSSGNIANAMLQAVPFSHIGLFEGIGGFSLAARWMGWETIAWCEWIEYNKKILRKHFPKANEHGDITKTDFTIYRGNCDLITGGFPCQPFSTAGKMRGQEDERYLWDEMFRAIKEVNPDWVVAENVTGFVNIGLDKTINDMESEGYETRAFIIPACSVGAWHKRERVWIVANLNGRGWNTQPLLCTSTQERYSANDANCSNATERGQNQWMAEPDLVRVVHGVSRKLDKIRVKQLGNSIVPQIALEIFKAVQGVSRHCL